MSGISEKESELGLEMKDVALRHILLQLPHVQTRPRAIREHPIVAGVWLLLLP